MGTVSNSDSRSEAVSAVAVQPSLDEIDLSDPDFWLRPLEERERVFATLRAREGLAFFDEPNFAEYGFPPGPGYHAVVRHADILEASRRSDVYSSARSSATNIHDMPEEFAEYFGSMINMDDPRHARLRRIVSRAFTPRMIQQIEDEIDRASRQIIENIIDKGECDFVPDVAARLPLKIICGMMGIPESEHDFVFDRSNIILGGFDTEYVPEFENVAAALLNAGQDLQTLVQDLARHRETEPAGDLVSSLVTANIDGERLTLQELGSFFILLVVAGNETTRNAISHGLRLLTENPDQRARWIADFDAYSRTAVEEIVRIASPVIWMRRTATQDHELGGHPIAEGDKVLLYYWSANRDESIFTDPYAFDIGRDPNPHVGFGGPGTHFCLGAHLARREIQVMFRDLLRWVPDIRMTGEPQRLRSMFINGIKHLPCDPGTPTGRPAPT
jgi:methyl-branched lipid omega-hydroxylase